jgi:Skp1 family, tetramerisation domain
MVNLSWLTLQRYNGMPNQMALDNCPRPEPSPSTEDRFVSIKNMAQQSDALCDTVKLISSDMFEFIIDRKCAMSSGTIKNMLSSPGIPALHKDSSLNLSRTKFTSEI